MRLIAHLRPHRLALLLFSMTLLLIMTYNSCQGPMSMGNGFQSASLCVAKPGLVRKMALSLSEKQRILKAQPSVFDDRKLQLGLPQDLNGAFQKPEDQYLEPGTELAILIDNECLQSLQSENASPFAQEVIHDRAPMDDLHLQTYAYELPRGQLISEFEEKINKDVCVKGVTYNQTYELASFYSDGSLNDIYHHKQRHFESLEAPESFPGFYHQAYGMKTEGSPVVVAVLDTGIDWQHPDLAANIWRPQINGQSFWGLDATTLDQGPVNYNPVDDSSDGHGTHVSGIISAISNNNTGVAGLMPFRSKIMAIKVFKLVTYNTDDNDPSNDYQRLVTTTDIVANAIRWAADHGAHVINLSIAKYVEIGPTDPGLDAAYEEALNYALNAGSFIVSATGNSTNEHAAQEINTTSFTVLPARYAAQMSGMMSVGSVDVGTGTKSNFSHWSKIFVEIAAPGSQGNGSSSPAGIFSTVATYTGSQTGYGVLAGTSMSAPMVSAAAALSIGLIRETHEGQVPNPAELERLISTSAVRSADLTNYFKMGRSLNFRTLLSTIYKEYPATTGKAVDSKDLASINCP